MSAVDIVVPCYDQARYLAESVGSALAQTHRDVHVWVVDDGSHDHPEGAIAAQLADPRVTFVRKDNAGVAHARNDAIVRGTGAHLLFLDADDRIEPDMVATLLPAFADDPDLGLAYCDIRHIDGAGAPTGDFSVGASRAILDGNILPSLMMGGYFPPVAVLVARKALERAGLFEQRFGGCCDWHLWARIAASGFTARYVDRRMAGYRIHAASMSQDAAHMSETMMAAIADMNARYPDEVAHALAGLIALNERSHRDNQFLSADVARLEKELAWHQVELASVVEASQRQAAHLQESLDWHTAQHESHRVALERSIAFAADLQARLDKITADAAAARPAASGR